MRLWDFIEQDMTNETVYFQFQKVRLWVLFALKERQHFNFQFQKVRLWDCENPVVRGLEYVFNSKRCDYEFSTVERFSKASFFSIPKGAIMSPFKIPWIISRFSFSIPKGAIMRFSAFCRWIFKFNFQFQKVRLWVVALAAAVSSAIFSIPKGAIMSYPQSKAN